MLETIALGIAYLFFVAIFWILNFLVNATFATAFHPNIWMGGLLVLAICLFFKK